MAYANHRLLQALQTTAARLRAGAPYQWGHLGMCNCGQLAQTITKRSRREIHEAALSRGGEWRDRAREYCPTSGFHVDEIIRELVDFGLNTSDLADLEHLSDDRVLRRLPEAQRGRELRRNAREDVVLYLETWAALLEDELDARARAHSPAA
ncbi:hypothetical protein G6O69_22065 [Pseudenhygromyxa sp. WMMC2535]|uniref:hypothetical protein n=1 Tax=Pseudenhygromyxa sp. WMMC2535 TaxID=2712867 RepID=UPI001556302C|nr:hypothetical protein [Pseudenhygromyxa sp. WMMC2535]NVB40543.1 hypothetical protein [Pseudenhygromyxa sp. WMMC2535]